MKKCDCASMQNKAIRTQEQFRFFKDFFDNGVRNGRFVIVTVDAPFYTGYNIKGEKMEWYADKWYQCNICGTMWEFRYPEFPASGFVGKI